MDPLPIDGLLPELVDTLRRSPAIVLEAPPGAGKTTRVPRALLEAGLAGEGEIVVLEPRRLAARMAARRVSEELKEQPGETVGWQVRFEDVSGPRTRIRYVTEALLTRRLLAHPSLLDVSAVVLDEFHERHLQGDLALALLHRLRAGGRPDLKLVVMSATLETEPVASFLSAPSLRSEGRAFPVRVDFLGPEEAARPLRLEDRVAGAVHRILREEPEGDVLVFLPGAAEIRRVRDALAPLTDHLEVLPLHGDLPAEQQDRAVRPSGRRKIVLSTNVAETSVTIQGVRAVVDSGLARVATHAPWSGLPALETHRISRASAAQRAGRAGRTSPGRCLRLFTRQDHDSRPEFEVPEILRSDLSETALVLAAMGVKELAWLEAPPAPAWEAARVLLHRLGALDAAGNITPLGLRLHRFPLHPRLARLVVGAEELGCGPQGALLAALLSERPIRERWDNERLAPPTGSSDLIELASLFEEAAAADFAPHKLRALGLAPGAVQAVRRSWQIIAALVARSPKTSGLEAEHALLEATLCAFPDRVARRRAAGCDDVVLAAGGSARIAKESVVRESTLLVAVEAEERRSRAGAPPSARGVAIRLASAVSQEMLFDHFPDLMRYEDALRFDEKSERVEGVGRLLYQDLVLEESRLPHIDPRRAEAILAEAALAKGAHAFAAEGALERLLARLAFSAHHGNAGAAVPSEDELSQAIRDLCAGRRSFAELREADLEAALLARLAPRERAALEKLAPERVNLSRGRWVKVQYPSDGRGPFIESRLQDFFGMAEGPRVAAGRVALVLHLLAPNGRAQQVTTDLAGFWERHYPALRRELMRRYPKHAWPENPLTASPPAPHRTR
ncbi:MAG TPA: ATP-dependent helicase HrpB [Anaeromyxobacteraceae bacterium]|nr:ATP-dependent helicase HrpB [Anaeromyxobacteraceae bacterium]